MEADWDEITRLAVPSAGLHAIPPPASAVAFDDVQELLWVGNDQVRSRITQPQNLGSNLTFSPRDGLRLSTVPTCNGMSRSRLTWAKVPSSSYLCMRKASSPSLPRVSIALADGA
jgi:hypothetical protein